MSAAPDRSLADLQQANEELRRQLTERTAERDEGLAREAAMAEVLGVINASPGGLAPVFEAMLDKAIRLCGAAQAALRTFDGSAFHFAAARGDRGLTETALRLGPIVPGPGHPMEPLMRGAKVLHLPDAVAATANSDYPGVRERVAAGGIRTWLAVALRKGDTLLGAILLHRREVRPFSEKEISLVENFAAQAVIAMENARLLTETREALEKQTATAEILRVISGSPSDVQPTFDAIAANATILTGAETGGVFRFDGSLIHFAAHYGYGADLLEAIQRDFPTRPGRHSAAARAILTREVAHIPDAAADPEYALPAMLKTGVHTLLSVPILQDGNPVGVISVTRREVEPFSQAQIDLLKTFADQAVIAIENVRLFNETREALEQQTATAEVLQVINASPGDLAPVFDAMLEKARRLCGADLGSFWSYDGRNFRVLASTVGGDVGRSVIPGPGTSHDRLVRGENVVQFADITKEEAYQEGVAQERTRHAGTRTALAVALRKEGALIGEITAGRREIRLFSEKQIALLQNFAAQAVIAMENARLLGELRARTGDLEQSLEYQTATSDVLQIISHSTFDLQPVLDTLVETAARLCAADLGLLSNREDEGLRVAATFSASPEYEAVIRDRFAPIDRGTVAGRAMLEGRTIQVTDLTSDPDYTVTENITLGKVRTGIGVPLLREGVAVGVLSLGRQRVEPFTERQIELVRTFADQAVIAIENARLLGELRQRTNEVAELNRSLEARVAAQIDELGRIGRLKRFLAPQLAEMIIAKGEEGVLESHRREIVVVFCDLRGYTAFTETAEPEDVLDFLRQYHGALGPLVSQFEGTLDQFSGDGIMVFFNDPVPCPDPAERAVEMAMAMREAANKLIAAWRRRHRCELGFGVGIAQGYATLGQIGFSERSGYTAIGTVCNLAARLCAEARDGQILVSSRVAGAVEAIAKLEDLGDLAVKGLSRPVAAFNVSGPLRRGPAGA